MSLLSKIFDFIKNLVTRPGLHTFLEKYQNEAVTIITRLAQVHDGKELDTWWDQAFTEVKSLVSADGKQVADNWVSIALNLAYEVYKAHQQS